MPSINACHWAAASTPAEADYIVAIVNTEPVTNNEVRARVARALRDIGEGERQREQAVAARRTGEVRRAGPRGVVKAQRYCTNLVQPQGLSKV